MSIFRSRRFQEIAGGVLMLAVFVLPVFAWAGSTKKVYVDASATGTQDGSQSHPYKTITQALHHITNDDEVHVAAGVYKENIKIPYSLKLFGADKDTTIIDADNDTPAVTMSHKTTLDKFTVKGGEHGIYVRKGSKASIIDVVVKNSDKDGIHVREANMTDKYSVNIVSTEVKDNDRAGIFSEKRKVVIIDTEVHDNGSDGVDIATGARAWIDDNTFRDNDGSGLKVSLDNSSILVASKNTFRDNKHEGVEVNAYGKTGTVSIVKSKFANNEKYGIARIARVANVSTNVWKGLTQSGNTFLNSHTGNVSPVLNIR
jgi:hypothetical protein